MEIVKIQQHFHQCMRKINYCIIDIDGLVTNLKDEKHQPNICNINLVKLLLFKQLNRLEELKISAVLVNKKFHLNSINRITVKDDFIWIKALITNKERLWLKSNNLTHCLVEYNLYSELPLP